MIHDDEIAKRLNELLSKHPEFSKLAQNDATVHSWLKTAMTFQNRDYVGSAEEILVGIIVAMGRDKEQMTKDHINTIRNCTCNPRLIV